MAEETVHLMTSGKHTHTLYLVASFLVCFYVLSPLLAHMSVVSEDTLTDTWKSVPD